jgi:hypothetical protein
VLSKSLKIGIYDIYIKYIYFYRGFDMVSCHKGKPGGKYLDLRQGKKDYGGEKKKAS